MSVLVCHNYAEGEFVLQVPIMASLESLSDFSDSRCRLLIRQALFANSQDDLEVEILTRSRWQMTNQIVSSLVSKGGRVYLAGDAAHLFAPAGGFGLNSGFQDGHCLAHKFRGETSSLREIAQEYSKERIQIANQNRLYAHSNYLKTVKVAEALGLRLSHA